MPYAEFLAEKKLDPRAMSSAEWELVSAQIRERAFFMAGVDHARTLQEFRKAAALVAQGKLSPREARRALRDFLRQSGYKAPEGKEGSIHDLSSRRRMDVVIDTNARMAAGWANRKQLLGDPAFPGQELVRIRRARQPRNWRQRWQEAARAVNYDGVARGGKMVARLDSPIWQKLSRFGLPYPPFDFGSGMGVLPVSAKECEKLGLTEPENPQREPGLNENISAEMGDAETARLAQEAAPGCILANGPLAECADVNGSTPRSAEALARLWPEFHKTGIKNFQEEGLTQWVNDHTYFDLDQEHTDAEKMALTQAMRDLISRLPDTSRADNKDNALYRALSWKSEEEQQRFLQRIRETGVFTPMDKHLAESFSSSMANTEKFLAKKSFQVIIVYDKPGRAKDIRPFYNAMPSLKQNIPHPTRLEAEYLLPNGVKLTAGNALKVETGRDGISRYIIHVHD